MSDDCERIRLEARALLRIFGSHPTTCLMWTAGMGFDGDGECTCGLDAVIGRAPNEQERAA